MPHLTAMILTIALAAALGGALERLRRTRLMPVHCPPRQISRVGRDGVRSP